MHPYFEFLDQNSRGELNDIQKTKLAKIVRWRLLCGILMVIAYAFLAIITTIPLVTGDLDIWFFWIFDFLYVAGFVYGIYITQEQLHNRKKLSSLKIVVIQATPEKINAAINVPHVHLSEGGMSLMYHLKVGIVKLNGKKYGSLSGLYPAIENLSPAEFYVIDISFGAIKGVIVNYL